MSFSDLKRNGRSIATFKSKFAYELLATAMLVVLVLAGSTRAASAASYQRTDGTIVDPILYRCCITSNGELLETHLYSGVNLAPEADLLLADLRDAALSNADLRGVNLTLTRLTNADLSGANLSGSTGYGGDLSGANLTAAMWVGGVADEMALGGANLSFADLRGWTASEAGAPGASFLHANLDDSYLAVLAQNADFTNASLRGARFDFIADTSTNLDEANFSGADLTGASFDSEYLGAPAFDQFRISLSGTNFSNAVLLNAIGLGNTLGAAIYDSQTDFTNAWADLDATIPFDPVAAGWTLVPEPGITVLMGLGLFGLGVRTRRQPIR